MINLFSHCSTNSFSLLNGSYRTTLWEKFWGWAIRLQGRKRFKGHRKFRLSFRLSFIFKTVTVLMKNMWWKLRYNLTNILFWIISHFAKSTTNINSTVKETYQRMGPSSELVSFPFICYSVIHRISNFNTFPYLTI